MSLFGGYALKQFQQELSRKLRDRGLFQSTSAPTRSTRTQVDFKKYDEILNAEEAAHRRRVRKANRQNLAWVIVATSLPVLLFVLDFLFFHGRR